MTIMAIITICVILSRGSTTGFIRQEDKREKYVTILSHGVHFNKDFSFILIEIDPT